MARTTSNGTICWGYDGQGLCGDGAVMTAGGPYHLSPVTALPTNVALFSLGATHGCAHSTAGITTCWGTNEYGERGSGTVSSLERTSTPRPVVW